MGERRSSNVSSENAQQEAKETSCLTDAQTAALDELERLASVSEVHDVSDCVSALKKRVSELSCSLAFSDSSVFGGLQDSRSMSAPLTHSPVISTQSVATQTVVLGAKPPRQPGQFTRRVNLRTKKRVCPRFLATPSSTILQIIHDTMWRINPRGKGCCTSHIKLECLFRHTSEALSRPCMNFPEVVDAWQCRRCFAINRGEDIDDLFCEVCDAEFDCGGERVDRHPSETGGESIGDADADCSLSGDCSA
eukprot:TRINITY_DN74727_c0_g1_i1.p1 TRINITY_DN74727_c0_g1~~TRINITY_DN74727_c0_g1_i1.p1  ORF type:complete len:262 (-),score=21.50 TRINITY_DN74727_c0_g1_i1:70-819(-)